MKTKKLIYSVLSVVAFFLFACNSSEDLSEKYRLNKKYWDPNDYSNALTQIRITKPDEKKPCYSVPEKAVIFSKLVDINNVSVVVEDEQLGLKHRAEFSADMFEQYQDMLELYKETDREDKYVYPMELVDVLKFGLYLQYYYFDLGNQKIIQSVDNPDESNVKSLVSGNVQSLIGNYCIYLSFINQEKSFSEDALNSFAEGIDKYFPKIIDKYPDADFSEMTQKSNDLLKKTKSQKVTESLTSISTKIEEKKVIIEL